MDIDLLVRRCLTLLKAFMAITIRVFISSTHLPFRVTTARILILHYLLQHLPFIVKFVSILSSPFAVVITLALETFSFKPRSPLACTKLRLEPKPVAFLQSLRLTTCHLRT